jgi:hypothetical protein
VIESKCDNLAYLCDKLLQLAQFDGLGLLGVIVEHLNGRHQELEAERIAGPQSTLSDTFSKYHVRNWPVNVPWPAQADV